jgi:folate-binding protein YgfZ
LQPESSNCNYFVQDCSVTVIEGKDAITHLNRIITSDIREIIDLECHKSLICDANGKIIDALEISSIAGQLLVQGISDNSKMTRDLIVSGIHWNEDVKTMNGDGALSIISIFTRKLDDIKRIIGENSVNEKSGIWNESDEFYTLKIELKKDVQVNILIQTEKIQGFIDMIEKQGAKSSSTNSWNKHRIENGILSNEEYAHNFLPSELGLEGIINLKKGCYPGQEIHARLESRGKITKKIMRYNADTILEPGIYKSNLGKKVIVTSTSKNKGLVVLSVKEGNEIIIGDNVSLTIEQL